MSYTALELANLALTALAEPSLAGFDGSGSTAAKGNQLFPTEFRALLKREGADWYWARKFAELTEDTVLTHYTGWDYVYDLPADLLVVQHVFGYELTDLIWERQDDHLMTAFLELVGRG